jgi:hypothetical protein
VRFGVMLVGPAGEGQPLREVLRSGMHG